MNNKWVKPRSSRPLTMEHDVIGASDVPAPSDAVQFNGYVNAQMAHDDSTDAEHHPEFWIG